ncbi:MAG: formate--tetrahydrofolate ligase, partial [Chloroflexi bacterium]
MKTSMQIAAEAHLEPISVIAERLGLPAEYLEPYGRYRGKIDLTFLDDHANRPRGRYILV